MSRGTSRIQSLIARAIQAGGNAGSTASELLTECCRAALAGFPPEMEPWFAEQRLHVVRRACWSLECRGIIHRRSQRHRITWHLGSRDAYLANLTAEIGRLFREVQELEAVT